MYSFCLKTNNNKIIEYIKKQINNENINSFKFSVRKFKIYNNAIFHYKGKLFINFYEKLSWILTNTIIKFYEKELIRKSIKRNYFYFDEKEQLEIFETAKELIDSDEQENKSNLIFIAIYNYIIENKSMILDGFINFRLKDYVDVIDYVTELSVNNFLIKKEYLQFINLLKNYIKTEIPKSSYIHLIHSNSETILLDKNLKQIDINTEIFDAKYLSDISFSSTDYALNTLLNILPKKIYIHVLDIEDEFIKMLKQIFDGRLVFCGDRW